MLSCITNWALRDGREVYPGPPWWARAGGPRLSDRAAGAGLAGMTLAASTGAAFLSIGALTDRKGCRYTGESRNPGERVGMTCLGRRAALERLRGARRSRRPDPRPAESAEEAVRVV